MRASLGCAQAAARGYVRILRLRNPEPMAAYSADRPDPPEDDLRFGPRLPSAQGQLAVGLDQALEAHLAKWGRVEDGPEAFGDAAFHYRDPTLGEGTAFRAGPHLAGIHGELGREQREAVLEALLVELR
jgi:hypothetical protein